MINCDLQPRLDTVCCTDYRLRGALPLTSLLTSAFMLFDKVLIHDGQGLNMRRRLR
jgi:hypothetical protein